MQPAAQAEVHIDERTDAHPAAREDRRQESRLPLDTCAVLHLVILGAKLPGRIVDLSLGGCCFRADHPFLLGVFRRIEVEFRMAGLPFRLSGVTQAIYDRHRIGIRFLDMSERKREQLRQLMCEMAENDPAIKIAPCADAASEDHARESANGSHSA
jgi:c-di-GMP-binding flagellar brake protein YcgR